MKGNKLLEQILVDLNLLSYLVKELQRELKPLVEETQEPSASVQVNGAIEIDRMD